MLKIFALVFILASIGAGYCDEQTAPYVVGPEDIIKVSVARHPEFSDEIFVPVDGVVDLQGVGQMNVRGMTLARIAEQVTDRLRGRLVEPEITVTLKTPRAQRVYVLGAVKSPGSYDAKPGWRITEAVAASGGLAGDTEPADCRVVILRAATGQRETVQLADVIRGAPEANAVVESGDVVTVEARETMPVYVVGKVQRPGLYRVRKDNGSVLETLAVAGGTLDEAALSRVSITHLDGSSQTVDLTTAVLDGKQDANVKLLPGDLVLVPEETARIAVLGYVRQPGFFPLRDGQKLTLSDALALANGAENPRGEIGSVAVVRTESGKQERLVFDLRKFFKSGDPTQNPEVKTGDIVYVPQSSKIEWNTIMGSLTSVGWLINPFVK